MKIIIENIQLEGLLAKAIELIRPRRRGRKRRIHRRLTDIHTVVMAKTAYEDAIRHLEWRGREEGGILIGPKNHHWVTHFVPDLDGIGTPGSFTLDAASLNATLRKYLPLGLDAKGLIHAHPPGCRRLSDGDMRYVRKLLGNDKNATDRLLMPLVVDGQLLPFIIFPSDPDTVHEGRLVLN